MNMHHTNNALKKQRLSGLLIMDVHAIRGTLIIVVKDALMETLCGEVRWFIHDCILEFYYNDRSASDSFQTTNQCHELSL